jgi:hypothetical protein
LAPEACAAWPQLRTLNLNQTAIALLPDCVGEWTMLQLLFLANTPVPAEQQTRLRAQLPQLRILP